jgi:hypothetical protein
MTTTPHPGSIEFVDETLQSTEVVAADSVPDSIAWYNDGHGRRPVVRVVAHMRGDQRILRSYGANGALLQTTIQVPV